MSSNLDRFKNPLIRDGVSQRQRQASSAALSPDFVKLDEWELADALVFAYHLSHQIRYHGQDGTLANWTSFFTNSTPVQIALISKTRPQTVKDAYNQQLELFLDDSKCDVAPVLEFWQTYLLKTIRDWYRNLEPYTPLKAEIKGLVKTNLEEPLIRIQSFEKGSGSNPLFSNDFAQEFGLNFSLVSTHAWTFDRDRANRRDELDKVFQVLFQTYRQIIQLAPQYLKSSLSDRQDHPPHLALYFAFWAVLQPARDDLNLMTQRHLEFFYRKVLCLNDRPAEPDRAHLLFELAKLPDLTEFKLPSGTRLKAGKDALGKDLFYTLDQDIVVHKAKIVSLKGVFLDQQDRLIRGLHASPIANSFDGKGGEFPKEQVIQSWLPFGDRSRDTVVLGLAIASTGLLLREGNRTITLTLTLQETRPEPIPGIKGRFADLTAAELQQLFKIKVSGKEKEWTPATLTAVIRTSPANLPDFTHQLTLTINLTADQSPLLPYRTDLPGVVLPTTKPVLLLLVNSGTADRIRDLAPYHFLRSLQLVDLQLETTVDQVRDLILQNDLSVLDASKPFQPFGPLPKPGSNLYIGSQEVFQKQLAELRLDLTLEQPKPANWLDIYAAYDPAVDATNPNQVSQNFEPGKFTIAALRARTWSSPVTSNLFNDGSIILTPELATLNLDSAIDSESIEPWTPQSRHSFLRLQLSTGSPRSDFLHAEYPMMLARQMVAVATNAPITIQVPVDANTPVQKQKRTSVIGAYYRRKGDQAIFKATTHHDADLDDEPIIPKEPYLPVIQSLSIFYRAIVQKQDCTLYHLCPFGGFVELKTENPYLLMQFTDSGKFHEGELLIGLQDLDPPTALPLLFQVAEESADALLKKALVQWFYLKDNTWHSLRDRIISDTTNGLVTSGIVHVGIPDDISNAQTTILDPTLYWIKASVTERSRAICQIINVHTQAAQANFTDTENDPNHLAIPLAAGAIAALEVAQSEIKTVEQPYASFGGRIKELPNHFYLRVSEQLRHKGRAVTIFDYERLVLEKFPEIYKVRCINHGLFDETQNHMHELMPGAVTLAVIPDLANFSTLHDLEPKVNINLLDKIKDYLMSLSSPWVEIKVVNPIYERIQIECRVKFKPPYDLNFGYYSRELNLAITDFLAPWVGNRYAEIQFGSTFYYSTILNFIEEQDYVDYIVDFKMNFAGQTNVREAIATSPRSVLTSGSSTQNEPFHRILEFQETEIINLPPQRLLQPNRLGHIRLEEMVLE